MPADALIAAARRGVEQRDVADLAAVLLAMPCPWGRERAAAEAVAAWLDQQLPGGGVMVDVFDADRANVVITSGNGGEELLVYSHLDTSLTGDPLTDEPVTGRRDPVAPADVGGDEWSGPGLAVARACAAAATVGYLAATRALHGSGIAHRTTLLLAAGGTHRRGRSLDEPATFGIGARRALAGRPRPAAVLVAKSGPPAVLHEEPGSGYVDITLRGRMQPAFLRADDDAGLPGRLPAALHAIERWRREFVGRPALGQVGREAAVGAVHAGATEKCDLLPATAVLSVYVVLGHGDDARQIAAELERAVAEGLGDRAVTVTARAAVWEPAGSTLPDAPIVEAVRAASGAGIDITGWRGSTDGTVFRAEGIDTARWGPAVAPDPADHRRDRVAAGDIADAARVYAETIVRFAAATASHPASQDDVLH
jgi:acetylornithine deacetylase/succinyl-diaminopimelate desuccinylase-like protein